MLKKLIIATVMLILATPALASHCPKDVKAVDRVLERIEAKEMPELELSDEKLAEVISMRDQGEELHEAGKHEESVEMLHKAMAILRIKH